MLRPVTINLMGFATLFHREANRQSSRFRRLVARKLDRFLVLDPSEILYFYVDNRIVRPRTVHDTVWVNYQLGDLEKGLKGFHFFWAHRAPKSLVNCATNQLLLWLIEHTSSSCCWLALLIKPKLAFAVQLFRRAKRSLLSELTFSHPRFYPHRNDALAKRGPPFHGVSRAQSA